MTQSPALSSRSHPAPPSPATERSSPTGAALRLVSSFHGRVSEILFDQNYLCALRDRDANAESFLISHFSRPVKARLRSRLRTPELVEDACQETFLRVISYFRSGKMLENPASLPGFVHSVCHNVSLELLRSHTRHSQMPENQEDPKDNSQSPEGRMVTEERKGLVAGILDQLSEKDRRLLRRVFLDEEDKDVVCRELNVDRNYLRLLVFRACGRFRAAAGRARAAGGF